MRQLLRFGLVFAVLASFLAPVSALAQEGTPTAADSAGIGPAVGTEVPYFGQDGVQIGTITVDEIVDPFEDYEAFSSPQRGYHFTLVTVSVTNTGTRPFEVAPNDFLLIDSEGFVASSAFAGRGDSPTVPDLEYTDALAPGDTVTGVVSFEVFNEAELARIVYWPDFDRLITIADLRTAPADAGDSVSVIGVDGTEMAQVTVNGMVDPFEDFGSGSAPPRGSRYILLDVTIANTGPRAISISPSDFTLVDDQGFVVPDAFVTRSDETVPDLPFEDLEPGQDVRGVIVYQLLSGVPVTQVVYGNLYDRQIVLADLGEGVPEPAGGALPEPDDSGTVEPTEVPDSGALEPTEVPIDEPTLGASSPDCEGLVEWGIDLVTRLAQASAAVEPLRGDVNTLDPATVQGIADQLATMADDQANSSPPPAAEDLNTFMTEQFFQALSDSTTRLVDALETGNTVTALLAQAEAEAVQALFDEGGEAEALLVALEGECPEEVRQLNEG